MSKLDDVFIFQTKHISVYEPGMKNVIISIAETKQQIKDLILGELEKIKPYESEDGRAFLPIGEVTKKIMEL